MEYIDSIITVFIVMGIFLLIAGIGILVGKLLKKRAADDYYDDWGLR